MSHGNPRQKETISMLKTSRLLLEVGDLPTSRSMQADLLTNCLDRTAGKDAMLLQDIVAMWHVTMKKIFH